MLLRKVLKRSRWIAAVTVLLATTSSYGQGRFGGMLSRGTNTASSIGGGVARRAGQSVGTARNYAGRGAGMARNYASSGAGVARQVGSGAASAGRNVARRSYNTTGAVVSRGAAITRLGVQSGAAIVPFVNGPTSRMQPGAPIADGLLRFNGATTVLTAPGPVNGGLGASTAPPQSVIPLRIAGPPMRGEFGATSVPRPPDYDVFAGPIYPANLGGGQPQNLNFPVQNALNGVAQIPPRLVQRADQVGQAAGLPPLPPVVGDIANIPQAVVNFPVKAFLKPKLAQVEAEIKQIVKNPFGVPGGLGGGGLILANEILDIVDAAQPAVIPIPAVVGLGGGGGGGGGGAADGGDGSGGGGGGAAAPAADPESPLGNVDLALEDMALAAPATGIAGPAYRVMFRNQGSAPAGPFYIVVLAGVDVRPTSDPPRALVEVPGLAAGQITEVTLRLPASAMQMVNSAGALTALTHVFVALDFGDAIVELDELNNIAIVEAAALEPAMQ